MESIFDNGYEEDGKGGYKQISTEGGNDTDYLYKNGVRIEQKTPIAWGGEVSRNRSYGQLETNGTGGATIDPSFDIVFTFAGGGASVKLTQVGLKYFGKWAFTSKALGYQSKLFGRFHSKFLPDGVKGSLNQGFFRTGWSNKGSLHIFRTAVGHKPNQWFKIDWFYGSK